jgi:hypothetical protein
MGASILGEVLHLAEQVLNRFGDGCVVLTTAGNAAIRFRLT